MLITDVCLFGFFRRTLVLIATLCLFRSPIGVTGLILVILILYGAYSGTKALVGTTQIPYTEVPVGTTEQIQRYP